MSYADADNSPRHRLADESAEPSSVSDADLRAFCDEIMLCLRVYGKLDEAEARRRLDESGICAPERVATELARSLLTHEEPYYWAMELLYAREYPRWWDEPSLGKLWPPPTEYHAPDWPHNVLRRETNK